MSLDGFIAGPQGEYDWIPNEPEMDWGAFMARFDTVLMGRRSYEAALAGGNVLPDMATYVFSRTLRPQDHPRVTIVGSSVDQTIEDLRSGSGKEIWLWPGPQGNASFDGHATLPNRHDAPVLRDRPTRPFSVARRSG